MLARCSNPTDESTVTVRTLSNGARAIAHEVDLLQGCLTASAVKPGTACTLNTMMVFVVVRLLTCGNDYARQATGAPVSLSQNGYGSPWFCNGRFTA